MLIDLHVHTSLSPCSRLDVASILTRARSFGLDGVCLTDHDTMGVRHLVREGYQRDGLLVLVGMEYATNEGDLLLFGPFEGLEPGLPAREVLRLVREVRGAAVAAHPCRRRRPARETLAAEGLLTAVETANGRNSLEENLRAQSWPRRHGLPGTGGSDAHRLEELGRSPTRFAHPVHSRAELIAALRQGRCAPAFPLGRRPQATESPAAETAMQASGMLV